MLHNEQIGHAMPLLDTQKNKILHQTANHVGAPKNDHYELYIALFDCYQPFHSTNISDIARHEFIAMNMLSLENEQSRHLNKYVLFPAPPNVQIELNNVMYVHLLC